MYLICKNVYMYVRMHVCKDGCILSVERVCCEDAAVPISSMNTLSDDCRKLKNPLLFGLSWPTLSLVAAGLLGVTFAGGAAAAAAAGAGLEAGFAADEDENHLTGDA